ncbi:MAG TPA: class I mannose-6-phosphate isomerase [Candidatus Limiplasma sp.]|nr:class I mannose-6-phosphate isomerase [Candidatus Limiplasma sp.]HPS82377.1 class I mannose-6-phosphate isomerase [Candidatus Limiplasma sp.]
MAVYQTIPIERPALWGGTLLREYFRYPWFGDQIGQSWSFSGLPGESNQIANGIFCGQTLHELWISHPELFQSRLKAFPVIISLVAPMDDLSIQIHPNAKAARAAGYASGKNEAWYFLEAAEGGDIVYGQTAENERELRKLVAEERWDELVCHLPVQQGDFVYLPAGILHALRKGSIVYEIQQATDVTYRFYDYHRKDARGQERPLHLEQAIACVDYSLSQRDAHPQPVTVALASGTMTTFIRNESFCVSRFTVSGTQTLRFTGYQLFTVVAGSGEADDLALSVGVNFLLPAGDCVTIQGDLTLMATCEQNAYLDL